MKKMINTTHIEGLLYQHTLQLKVTGEKSKNPGTPFISGNIEIATDNDLTNIVSIHYTYVTALTAKGKTNDTFNILNAIIDGKYKSVMADGPEEAVKLSVDSAIALNEFYSDRSGTEELVSVKRNEGGFIQVVSALNEDEGQRDTWKTDIVITSTILKEADEEKNIPEKLIVKGGIFNFRNELLPVEFSAVNPKAIEYFSGLQASNKNPIVTCIWGHQISEVITRQIVEESAFGEPSVREVTSTRKDFVITGASPQPMEWDDESTILASELTKALSDREVNLAAMKARQEEYKASLKQPVAPAASVGGFNF